jgi:hypothetical protein
MLPTGNHTLSCKIHHPDGAQAPPMNVTFYESTGRVIGVNNSGFNDGDVVTCNSTFHLHYNATDYGWYAVASDDEFTGYQSDVWQIKTYHNTTEPSQAYYTSGGDVFVEEEYTDSEPSNAFYTSGGQINVYTTPFFSYPSPANQSTGVSTQTGLGIYLYKEGDANNWDAKFYVNDTLDETWYQKGQTETVELGYATNNLTQGDYMGTGSLSQVLNSSEGLKLGRYLYNNPNIVQGVSWYNFEENEGTIAYDRWDDNNGSFSGNPQWTTSKGGNGTSKYALDFDGNDKVAISDADNLDISNNITMSAWVNPDSLTTDHATIATKVDSYFFQVHSNGTVAVYTYYNDSGSRGSSSYTYSNTSIPSDSWSHIAFVEENGTRKIYIDGVLDKTAEKEPSIWTSTEPLEIGGQGSQRFFDGQIDEVSIYGQALNSSQIQEIYDNGLGETKFYSSGTRTSPIYNLDGRAKDNGKVNWSQTIPTNTAISVSYKISTDSGSSWTGWQSLSNNSGISEISDGTLIDSYQIQFKQTLETTDDFKTPYIEDFKLNIDRYLFVSVPYSGLDYNTTYWWYANLTHTDYGTFQSDMYHFTTEVYSPSEPSQAYYTSGGDVFVEEEYTDSEPTSAYYTAGGEIRTREEVFFNDEHPSNGSVDVSIDTDLSAWVNKSGDRNHYDVTFYSNDTNDESWIVRKSFSQIQVNKSLNVVFSGLQYDTKYYWKIEAVNTSLNYEKSEIYHFTTKTWSASEPSTSYYTAGGDIFVEETYTDSEPSTSYYTAGGQIKVGFPFEPVNPEPADGSSYGYHILDNFSCYVEDIQDLSMNVSFYKSDGTLMDTAHNVESGTRAKIPLPTSYLTNYTTLSWYAVADNGQVTTQSETWTYRPGNHEPTVTYSPQEGNDFVPIRHKLAGNQFQEFVRLEWTISDQEGDDIDYQIYVDDPDIAGWNNWELRRSQTGIKSVSDIQDETWFDTPDESYTWRIYVTDGYNTTNYYMNFTSAFYFWADFTWEPYRASTEDVVNFTDQSLNATSFQWKINGNNVSTVQNLSYHFNISNIYNITLRIHNETADVYDSLTRYIYIDKNISLNRTSDTVINYYGYSLPKNISAYQLSKNMNLSEKVWIHRYNKTTHNWESFWVNKPGLGKNYTLNPWDVLVFSVDKNISTRINISDNPDQREAYYSRQDAEKNMTSAHQMLYLPEGINYIVWSNIHPTNATSLDIGLSNIEDYIYKYDQQNNTFQSHWVGMTGNFEIKPHDVLILKLGSSKIITVDSGIGGS